jgi:hypothetical protein
VVAVAAFIALSKVAEMKEPNNTELSFTTGSTAVIIGEFCGGGNKVLSSEPPEQETKLHTVTKTRIKNK